MGVVSLCIQLMQIPRVAIKFINMCMNVKSSTFIDNWCYCQLELMFYWWKKYQNINSRAVLKSFVASLNSCQSKSQFKSQFLEEMSQFNHNSLSANCKLGLWMTMKGHGIWFFFFQSSVSSDLWITETKSYQCIGLIIKYSSSVAICKAWFYQVSKPETLIFCFFRE